MRAPAGTVVVRMEVDARGVRVGDVLDVGGAPWRVVDVVGAPRGSARLTVAGGETIVLTATSTVCVQRAVCPADLPSASRAEEILYDVRADVGASCYWCAAVTRLVAAGHDHDGRLVRACTACMGRLGLRPLARGVGP